MSEAGEQSREPMEGFKQRYGEELGELIDGGFYDEEPLPPDPASMGMGETNLEDLSEDELSAVEETILGNLGVNRDDSELLVREYVSEAPAQAKVPGEIRISVYKTNREGLFLQEMVFADGQKRWVMGPDINI